ncbi:MAG: hypothetical protein LC789_09620 [Actinobacteria bacterium]|nr:hypothetical protein [Actinomycetota bacterium]MCA1722403.1 hypothetical protein [Actinomycetota bacterium]
MLTVEAALAAGSRALGEVLSEPQELKGSDRTLVVRAQAARGSVVVKLHRDATTEPAVREPAGLEVAAGQGTPRLLAVTDPPGVVLEDVGTGDDLAALLLGNDLGAAADGLRSWATALGTLHARTGGCGTQLQDALDRHAARLGVPAPTAAGTPAMLAWAADGLRADLPLLGVEPSAPALAELRGLDDLLGGPAAARTLTPSDACPDNNRLTATGLVLLDLEGAQLRHVAWDAAYLLVPWPSCWCSWLPTQEAADSALEAWRTAVALPYAREPAFADDLRTVSLGWAMTSAAWFVRRAVQDDHPHPSTPSRRAMVQHRLASVAAQPDARVPALAALADELLQATKAAWGDVPLELAPAFR